MCSQAVRLVAIIALLSGSIVQAQNPTCEYSADANFNPKDNYAGEMQLALSKYRVDNPSGSENNVTAGATMGWFKGWSATYSPGPGSQAIQCFDMCQPCLNTAAASKQTDAICRHYTIDVMGHSGNCWIGFHVVDIDWAINGDPNLVGVATE
ncbi:MAG: hypothetical protein M1812_004644 [Candelaria pacifica]|nr:MAG: hypothetical protein M1812_004644 [Candelaria pacifica]